MEQPILHIQYLTEDPEIRTMIDMYWALDENNRPLYKKPDFMDRYGLDTTRLVKKLNEYFTAYSIDDICPKCKKPAYFLKARKDKYEVKKNWMCESCTEVDKAEYKQIRIKWMKKVFDELTYHSLSPLQLNIFKGLVKTRDITYLASTFGMSNANFDNHVSELNKMSLLDFDMASGELIIIDEYKTIFENERPEQKVKSIFGPNNWKLYQHLKRTHPYVYPEIPVCTFIEIETIDHLLTANWHKGYFLKCRVDALVCEGNGVPRFAVEFQGSYHSEKEQKVKDELKKNIIEEVGIPINYYTYKDLK